MNIFTLFSPKIVADFKSEFNKKIQIVQNKGKKIIYVGQAEQTGGTITGMWQKTFSNLPKTKDQRPTALLLGLGGGDVIRILQKIYPQIKITAVEIDPVMIEISENYFGIRNSDKLRIIQEDAFAYIKNKKNKYDLIVIDLFIGKYNPGKFRRLSFLRKLKNNIKKNGIIIYNSHYQPDNPEEFQWFYALCQKVFPQSSIILKYPLSRIIMIKY